MSTALVPYVEMQNMAKALAVSGLFGVKTPEQALALMLIAQAEGLHPAVVARDYYIVNGRPAKTSEAMMRAFLMAGGCVQWHELTDAKAEATFSHPQGGTVKIDWTMERAAKAGLSTKKNRDGSDNMYQRFPRQMLRARVISEGVRTICPLATSGFYTPEETEGFGEGALDITTRRRKGHGWSHQEQPGITAGEQEPETVEPEPDKPVIGEAIPPEPALVETTPGVYEPKPELVAKKWFTRIEQSPTVDMLKEIGKLLKDAPLSEEDKEVGRKLYTARMKQLKDQQEPVM